MHMKIIAMDLVFNAANVSLLLAAQAFTKSLGKSVGEPDFCLGFNTMVIVGYWTVTHYMLYVVVVFDSICANMWRG